MMSPYFFTSVMIRVGLSVLALIDATPSFTLSLYDTDNSFNFSFKDSYGISLFLSLTESSI